MILEVGIISVSTILATIIGVILSRHLGKNKWKRIWLPGSIPMWVVARAYREWYSDKGNLPRRELIIKGSFYEYKAISKDKDMIEPHARVNNMVVYRREQNAKK